MLRKLLLCGAVGALAILGSAASAKADEPGYKGAPRTYLFNPAISVCFHDTAKYKKKPPYVIGFSNAGLGDSWRVVGLHSLEKAAHDHADVIKKLIITNANHDDSKQIADIQDLALAGHRPADRQRQHAAGARSGRLARDEAGHPGGDGRSPHRLRQLRDVRDRLGRDDGAAVRAVDRREAARQGQRGDARRPGRLQPVGEPREAGARGVRAISRHQDPRHGLFRLEPGEGQAGDAGGDRQVRSQDRRRLVARTGCRCPARSRRSSMPGGRPARSRCTRPPT